MKAFEKIGRDRTGLMEKQSQTINGLMSTIQSGIFKLRMELGDLIVKEFKLQKIMKKIIEYLDKTVRWIHTLSPAVKKLILGLLVFAAVSGPVILALGLILKGLLGIVIAMTAWKLLIASGMLQTLALSLLKITASMALLAAEVLLVAAVFALFYIVVEDIMGYFMGKDSLIIPAWKKIFSELFDWLSTTWYGKWGDFLWGLVEKWKSGATMIVDAWKAAWASFFSWYTENPVVKAMMSVGGWMARSQREVRANSPYGGMWGVPPAASTSTSSGPQINVNVGSLSVPVTGGMGIPWKAELQQNAKEVIQLGILDQIKNALRKDIETATRR
jgi:hypothetical protein